MVTPESIGLQQMFDVRVNCRDFGQLFMTGRGCADGKGTISVLSVLSHHPMQQKNDFLGENCYISTGLSKDAEFMQKV